VIRILCVLVLLAASSSTFAACVCRCVNGEVRPICSSSLDIEPICAPQVCPVVPPSVEPIRAPRVSPIGTTSCRQAQVYSPKTARYEWREVCQ
jgi:hypothetical protein